MNKYHHSLLFKVNTMSLVTPLLATYTPFPSVINHSNLVFQQSRAEDVPMIGMNNVYSLQKPISHRKIILWMFMICHSRGTSSVSLCFSNNTYCSSSHTSVCHYMHKCLHFCVVHILGHLISTIKHLYENYHVVEIQHDIKSLWLY